MNIGIVKESFPHERRTALIPEHVTALKRKQHEVYVESGAGLSAGFSDAMYTDREAKIVAQRADVFSSARFILQVRGLGANPEHGRQDLDLMTAEHILVGSHDPLSRPESVKELAGAGVTAFAMELMPRITRAQSMDVLSSMATIAGYKAVLLAAEMLPKMFPMMMTAAGTITPARVFVVGAGVAGLQAVASARKLGAVVSAYDIRPAVKEQIESLGGKFVEMDLEAGTSEDKGGYAKEMGEEFYRRQRELMARVVAENDVVITTAAVPGKKSPVLITEDMVQGMHPGSVIIDLAAERGGNCELTKADETTVVNHVTISGPTNLPATVPNHASQMYGKNLVTFLDEIIVDGQFKLDPENEVSRDTLLTREGQVVQPRVREILGMTPDSQNVEEVTAND